MLISWLEEFGYNKTQIVAIVADADSDRVNEAIIDARDVVDNQIKTLKIPTMIYDGRRHQGLFIE